MWSVVGVAHLVVDIRAWEAVTRYLSEFTSRGQTGVALATLQAAVVLETAVAALGFGLVWVASSWIATRLFADPSLEALIVLGSGQPGAATVAATASAAGLVVLLPLLAPEWGASGAGWARVGGALAYLAVVLAWLVRVGRRASRADR